MNNDQLTQKEREDYGEDKARAALDAMQVEDEIIRELVGPGMTVSPSHLAAIIELTRNCVRTAGLKVISTAQRRGKASTGRRSVRHVDCYQSTGFIVRNGLIAEGRSPVLMPAYVYVSPERQLIPR